MANYKHIRTILAYLDKRETLRQARREQLAQETDLTAIQHVDDELASIREIKRMLSNDSEHVTNEFHGATVPPAEQHVPITEGESQPRSDHDGDLTIPATSDVDTVTSNESRGSHLVRLPLIAHASTDVRAPDGSIGMFTHINMPVANLNGNGDVLRPMISQYRRPTLGGMQNSYRHIVEDQSGDRWAMSCHECGANATTGRGYVWYMRPGDLQYHYKAKHQRSIKMKDLLDTCNTTQIDDEDLQRIIDREEPKVDIAANTGDTSKWTKARRFPSSASGKKPQAKVGTDADSSDDSVSEADGEIYLAGLREREAAAVAAKRNREANDGGNERHEAKRRCLRSSKDKRTLVML